MTVVTVRGYEIPFYIIVHDNPGRTVCTVVRHTPRKRGVFPVEGNEEFPALLVSTLMAAAVGPSNCVDDHNAVEPHPLTNVI